MTRDIKAGVRRLFRLAVRHRDTAHEEMDQELRFHLDERVAQFVARGMPEDDARREALRRLGKPEDAARQAWHHDADQRDRRAAWHEWLDDLGRDIHYAARGLANRPGFTLVAVVTLAIGIGGNTAIFSAVDALLLRRLPFADPGRLMAIAQTPPRNPAAPSDQLLPWSWPKYVVYRDHQQSFRSVALYDDRDYSLIGENPERLHGETVTAGYLSTLGITPIAGNDFPRDEDAHPGAARVAIISNALWQRRFHGSPTAIGQVVDLDSDPYQIVGVAPPGFNGLTGHADIWVPVTAQDSSSLNQPWSLEYSMVGRLKPGVTAAHAASEARTLGPVVFRETPIAQGMLFSGPKGTWGADARPLNAERIAPVLRRSLLVLWSAVGFVLLIACVNLASLLLGRAAVRRREIAIRLAIGARRGRLVRLLLAESLLLALLGGVAGVLLATAGIGAMSRLNAADALNAQQLTGLGVASFGTIRLDATTLIFSFSITLLVGVLFGLVPALQATRPQVVDAMRHGDATRGHTGPIGGSRRALVAAEVALALVLLAGSGLMLRSLGKLLATDLGFDAGHVLTIRLATAPGAVAQDSMPGFYDQLLTRLGALPGVTSAGLAGCAPFTGGCAFTIITFPDKPAVAADANQMVGVQFVSPEWFRTMHVPVRQGRTFTSADRIGAPKVLVVNAAAARKFWPGENPIGKLAKVYQGGFWTGATVVGVVGDVLYQTIDSVATPDAYISYDQFAPPAATIFLRTSGNPTALAAAARRTVQQYAPNDPVYDIRTMDALVGAASAQTRLSAVLLGLFAGVALLLAVIGIYGVVSFAVTQRTREIGIRVALGADRGRVLTMVVRQGAALVVTGAAIGLVAALLLTRVMRSLLFGVTPGDPLTFVAIVVVLVTAALVATWLPARRATRIDPVVALREG